MRPGDRHAVREPRQFNNAEDFAKYPRTEQDDAAALAPLAVDALFVPDAAEVYPPDHATVISVSGVTEPLEGAHRPGHFDGVATVVTLLLNMTGADRAYFGERTGSSCSWCGGWSPI